MQTNTVIVRGHTGVLLVDAGIHGGELAALADELIEHGDTVWSGSRPIRTGTICCGTPGLVRPPATAPLGVRPPSRPGWKSDEAWPARALRTCRWICSARSSPYRPGRSTSLGRSAGPHRRAPGSCSWPRSAAGRERAGTRCRRYGLRCLDPLLDLHGGDNPVQDYLDALRRFEDIASEADTFVPGHGSVGTGDELRRRIDQDRAYVIALRDGHDPVDVRVGPVATFGRELATGDTPGRSERFPRSARRRSSKSLTVTRMERFMLSQLAWAAGAIVSPVELGEGTDVAARAWHHALQEAPCDVSRSGSTERSSGRPVTQASTSITRCGSRTSLRSAPTSSSSFSDCALQETCRMITFDRVAAAGAAAPGDGGAPGWRRSRPDAHASYTRAPARPRVWASGESSRLTTMMSTPCAPSGMGRTSPATTPRITWPPSVRSTGQASAPSLRRYATASRSASPSWSEQATVRRSHSSTSRPSIAAEDSARH